MGFLWLAAMWVLTAAQTDSDRKSALLEGDVIFGVLFPVHHQPRQGHHGLSCGAVREMYGIQRIEATFMTLDLINSDPDLLPNVTLGVEIRDSCWYAPIALQQSIEFIRDAIHSGKTTECAPEEELQPDIRKLTEEPHLNDEEELTRPPLIGVVGPASSSVAIQVQNLFQLFHIPQIGYSTTSRDLSDKSRFSYFLRVVPSDFFQAQVMVDVVRSHNWTYVSAVNTDENYGQSGMQAFRELADRANVCIAKDDSVRSNAPDERFEAVINKLNEDKNARVVVCFCEGMTVRGLLRATKTLNLTGRFLFIGSDGWADRADVTTGLEEQARGSISIRIFSPVVKEFDPYYLSLNPYNNSRNPWFREFWKTRFNCTFENDLSNEYTNYTEEEQQFCTGEENLGERYKPDPKLSFVVKAIYTIAHGLHMMRDDICGIRNGLCEDMFPFDGTLYKNYLMNVTFSYDGDDVEFDRRGDPPGRYELMNFQRLESGEYDYIRVGEWNNGTLIMDGELQFSQPFIESVCSKPCPRGYFKRFQTGGQEKKCCWVCIPCHRSEILLNETNCERCVPGWWPNENKTACYALPEEFVQWSDPGSIVSMTVSVLGLMLTAITAIIFILHNDTPVVKSSTRELSYVIMGGMMTSHCLTYSVLAKPTPVTCTAVRVLPGLCFAMIYGALFVKTHRISRILAVSKKRFPSLNMRFMSVTAQVVMTTGMTGVEVCILTLMLLREPAEPTFEYPSADRIVLVCKTSPTALLAPLGFDAFLVLLCTLYAYKTRNVPENFNEAKFIVFCMYTTCVIWIAFCPIYFGSNAKEVTLSLSVSMSSLVTLIFLFFPKMYIILFRPERNNRAYFATTNLRCHFGSQVTSAHAGKNKKHLESTTTSNAKGSNKDGDEECRTISIQTGISLLDLLLVNLHSISGTKHREVSSLKPVTDNIVETGSEWVDCSHIVEESASEHSDDISNDGSSGSLKNITISLGVARKRDSTS